MASIWELALLNTLWDTRSITAEPEKTHLDLRYEFIKQNQLKLGTRNISQTNATSATTELKALNRNHVTTLGYAFNPQWGISACLPLVSRSHAYIPNPAGAADTDNYRPVIAGPTLQC